VPPLARSNAPACAELAPVKDPRSCPNNSPLGQVAGHRATVEHHERTSGAHAVFVDGVRQHILTGTSFTDQGDGELGGREAVQYTQHLLHGRRPRNGAAKMECGIDGAHALRWYVDFDIAVAAISHAGTSLGVDAAPRGEGITSPPRRTAFEFCHARNVQRV